MIPLRIAHVVFYAAVVTLTVTLAVGFGFWFIRRQMLTGNDFLLDAESKEILARIEQITPPIDARNLEAALREHTENDRALFYFQVHEPKGRVLYHSPNLGGEALTSLTGRLGKRTVNLQPFGLLRVAEYHTPTVQVQIAMSLRNFQSINDSFVRVFLVGVPLIAVLSIGFGMALRHSTLRPVRLMQSTARRISANNLGERIVVPTGGGEMAALARLLNDMIERLEKSFNHVKRFTADVSHELMTPLSIIRLHTERLLNDPELPAKYQHSVEEQLQETLHLAETVEQLLMLAKADSNVLPLRLQPVSTCDFMGQFAEDALLLAESRGLKVVVAQNDCGFASFDQGWIRQVMFNLLSNALRFSPPNGTITFHSKCADGTWAVEVWDEGNGVPPIRINEIFERFIQITPLSEPGSGAGLGLAICKSIVQLHKGRISAQNRTDRTGLAVAFSLPLNNAGVQAD
ncbi:MAG: two-component sensor histidine kinase [Pedosphaera sp.]|nr:two-component sensor histidine kinase [Pedosphaera sp.]